MLTPTNYSASFVVSASLEPTPLCPRVNLYAARVVLLDHAQLPSSEVDADSIDDLLSPPGLMLDGALVFSRGNFYPVKVGHMICILYIHKPCSRLTGVRLHLERSRQERRASKFFTWFFDLVGSSLRDLTSYKFTFSTFP